MVFLNYKKLDESLPDLKYAYEEDCCFDLVSAIDVIVYPNSYKPTIIPSGMIFDVPVGHELQIRPRSGLAAKNTITVLNSPGTIDSNFSNEVQIMLINFGSEPYEVKKGTRIAQAKVSIKPSVTLRKVKEIKSIGRGENGLGSTGV